MLVELDIKNFAIIKTLKVRFQEKMTVLIGETGAGKSIIIDAVSLLLGSRAQSEMIRSGEEKAVITGLFVLSEQKDLIEDLCEKYGLPFEDDQLIISRELTHKGRNVVRINGQLTTINVLREIGRNLVDIHGQNDQQILMDQDRQIDLIDNYAEPEFKKELHSYKVDFEKWRHLTSQLRKLREDAQEIAQKQDILEFQNNELESADLNDPNEDENPGATVPATLLSCVIALPTKSSLRLGNIFISPNLCKLRFAFLIYVLKALHSAPTNGTISMMS